MIAFKDSITLKEMLYNNFSSIRLKDGESWYYCPYWFKPDEKFGFLMAVDFEQLPTQLLEEIIKQRDAVQQSNKSK